MSLTATSRLGPYEVIAPLGAGGMGEVYKGSDTRLERTVAPACRGRCFRHHSAECSIGVPTR